MKVKKVIIVAISFLIIFCSSLFVTGCNNNSAIKPTKIEKETLQATATSFYAGTGTEKDPYLITSQDEWNYFVNLMNDEFKNNCSDTYKDYFSKVGDSEGFRLLMSTDDDSDDSDLSFSSDYNDSEKYYQIICERLEVRTPILYFRGNLDGGYVDMNSHVPVILYNSGKISYVEIIKDSDIKTNDNREGTLLSIKYKPTSSSDYYIWESLGGLVCYNSGIIDHCSIVGSTVKIFENKTETFDGLKISAASVGGLVGVNAEGGFILDCYSYNNIIKTSGNGCVIDTENNRLGSLAGGIVGYFANGDIDTCFVNDGCKISTDDGFYCYNEEAKTLILSSNESTSGGGIFGGFAFVYLDIGITMIPWLTYSDTCSISNCYSSYYGSENNGESNGSSFGYMTIVDYSRYEVVKDYINFENNHSSNEEIRQKTSVNAEITIADKKDYMDLEGKSRIDTPDWRRYNAVNNPYDLPYFDYQVVSWSFYYHAEGASSSTRYIYNDYIRFVYIVGSDKGTLTMYNNSVTMEDYLKKLFKLQTTSYKGEGLKGFGWNGKIVVSYSEDDGLSLVNTGIIKEGTYLYALEPIYSFGKLTLHDITVNSPTAYDTSNLKFDVGGSLLSKSAPTTSLESTSTDINITAPDGFIAVAYAYIAGAGVYQGNSYVNETVFENLTFSNNKYAYSFTFDLNEYPYSSDQYYLNVVLYKIMNVKLIIEEAEDSVTDVSYHTLYHNNEENTFNGDSRLILFNDKQLVDKTIFSVYSPIMQKIAGFAFKTENNTVSDKMLINTDLTYANLEQTDIDSPEKLSNDIWSNYNGYEYGKDLVLYAYTPTEKIEGAINISFSSLYHVIPSGTQVIASVEATYSNGTSLTGGVQLSKGASQTLYIENDTLFYYNNGERVVLYNNFGYGEADSGGENYGYIVSIKLKLNVSAWNGAYYIIDISDEEYNASKTVASRFSSGTAKIGSTQNEVNAESHYITQSNFSSATKVYDDNVNGYINTLSYYVHLDECYKFVTEEGNEICYAIGGIDTLSHRVSGINKNLSSNKYYYLDKNCNLYLVINGGVLASSLSAPSYGVYIYNSKLDFSSSAPANKDITLYEGDKQVEFNITFYSNNYKESNGWNVESLGYTIKSSETKQYYQYKYTSTQKYTLSTWPTSCPSGVNTMNYSFMNSGLSIVVSTKNYSWSELHIIAISRIYDENIYLADNTGEELFNIVFYSNTLNENADSWTLQTGRYDPFNDHYIYKYKYTSINEFTYSSWVNSSAPVEGGNGYLLKTDSLTNNSKYESVEGQDYSTFISDVLANVVKSDIIIFDGYVYLSDGTGQPETYEVVLYGPAITGYDKDFFYTNGTTYNGYTLYWSCDTFSGTSNPEGIETLDSVYFYIRTYSDIVNSTSTDPAMSGFLYTRRLTELETVSDYVITADEYKNLDNDINPFYGAEDNGCSKVLVYVDIRPSDSPYRVYVITDELDFVPTPNNIWKECENTNELPYSKTYNYYNVNVFSSDDNWTEQNWGNVADFNANYCVVGSIKDYMVTSWNDIGQYVPYCSDFDEDGYLDVIIYITSMLAEEFEYSLNFYYTDNENFENIEDVSWELRNTLTLSRYNLISYGLLDRKTDYYNLENGYMFKQAVFPESSNLSNFFSVAQGNSLNQVAVTSYSRSYSPSYSGIINIYCVPLKYTVTMNVDFVSLYYRGNDSTIYERKLESSSEELGTYTISFSSGELKTINDVVYMVVDFRAQAFVYSYGDPYYPIGSNYTEGINSNIINFNGYDITLSALIEVGPNKGTIAETIIIYCIADDFTYDFYNQFGVHCDADYYDINDIYGNPKGGAVIATSNYWDTDKTYVHFTINADGQLIRKENEYDIYLPIYGAIFYIRESETIIQNSYIILTISASNEIYFEKLGELTGIDFSDLMDTKINYLIIKKSIREQWAKDIDNNYNLISSSEPSYSIYNSSFDTSNVTVEKIEDGNFVYFKESEYGDDISTFVPNDAAEVDSLLAPSIPATPYGYTTTDAKWYDNNGNPYTNLSNLDIQEIFENHISAITFSWSAQEYKIDFSTKLNTSYSENYESDYVNNANPSPSLREMILNANRSLGGDLTKIGNLSGWIVTSSYWNDSCGGVMLESFKTVNIGGVDCIVVDENSILKIGSYGNISLEPYFSEYYSININFNLGGNYTLFNGAMEEQDNDSLLYGDNSFANGVFTLSQIDGNNINYLTVLNLNSLWNLGDQILVMNDGSSLYYLYGWWFNETNMNSSIYRTIAGLNESNDLKLDVENLDVVAGIDPLLAQYYGVMYNSKKLEHLRANSEGDLNLYAIWLPYYEVKIHNYTYGNEGDSCLIYNGSTKTADTEITFYYGITLDNTKYFRNNLVLYYDIFTILGNTPSSLGYSLAKSGGNASYLSNLKILDSIGNMLYTYLGTDYWMTLDTGYNSLSDNYHFTIEDSYEKLDLSNILEEKFLNKTIKSLKETSGTILDIYPVWVDPTLNIYTYANPENQALLDIKNITSANSQEQFTLTNIALNKEYSIAVDVEGAKYSSIDYAVDRLGNEFVSNSFNFNDTDTLKLQYFEGNNFDYSNYLIEKQNINSRFALTLDLYVYFAGNMYFVKLQDNDGNEFTADSLFEEEGYTYSYSVKGTMLRKREDITNYENANFKLVTDTNGVYYLAIINGRKVYDTANNYLSLLPTFTDVSGKKLSYYVYPAQEEGFAYDMLQGGGSISINNDILTFQGEENYECSLYWNYGNVDYIKLYFTDLMYVLDLSVFSNSETDAGYLLVKVQNGASATYYAYTFNNETGKDELYSNIASSYITSGNLYNYWMSKVSPTESSSLTIYYGSIVTISVYDQSMDTNNKLVGYKFKQHGLKMPSWLAFGTDLSSTGIDGFAQSNGNILTLDFSLEDMKSITSGATINYRAYMTKIGYELTVKVTDTSCGKIELRRNNTTYSSAVERTLNVTLGDSVSSTFLANLGYEMDYWTLTGQKASSSYYDVTCDFEITQEFLIKYVYDGLTSYSNDTTQILGTLVANAKKIEFYFNVYFQDDSENVGEYEYAESMKYLKIELDGQEVNYIAIGNSYNIYIKPIENNGYLCYQYNDTDYAILQLQIRGTTTDYISEKYSFPTTSFSPLSISNINTSRLGDLIHYSNSNGQAVPEEYRYIDLYVTVSKIFKVEAVDNLELENSTDESDPLMLDRSIKVNEQIIISATTDEYLKGVATYYNYRGQETTLSISKFDSSYYSGARFTLTKATDSSEVIFEFNDLTSKYNIVLDSDYTVNVTFVPISYKINVKVEYNGNEYTAETISSMINSVGKQILTTFPSYKIVGNNGITKVSNFCYNDTIQLTFDKYYFNSEFLNEESELTGYAYTVIINGKAINETDGSYNYTITSDTFAVVQVIESLGGVQIKLNMSVDNVKGVTTSNQTQILTASYTAFNLVAGDSLVVYYKPNIGYEFSSVNKVAQVPMDGTGDYEGYYKIIILENYIVTENTQFYTVYFDLIQYTANFEYYVESELDENNASGEGYYVKETTFTVEDTINIVKPTGNETEKDGYRFVGYKIANKEIHVENTQMHEGSTTVIKVAEYTDGLVGNVLVIQVNFIRQYYVEIEIEDNIDYNQTNFELTSSNNETILSVTTNPYKITRTSYMDNTNYSNYSYDLTVSTKQDEYSLELYLLENGSYIKLELEEENVTRNTNGNIMTAKYNFNLDKNYLFKVKYLLETYKTNMQEFIFETVEDLQLYQENGTLPTTISSSNDVVGGIISNLQGVTVEISAKDVDYANKYLSTNIITVTIDQVLDDEEYISNYKFYKLFVNGNEVECNIETIEEQDENGNVKLRTIVTCQYTVENMLELQTNEDGETSIQKYIGLAILYRQMYEIETTIN